MNDAPHKAGANKAGDAFEFARPTDIRQADGRTVTLKAAAAERQALARRFDIVAIDRLTAELTVQRHGETVSVQGSLTAAIVQSCAVSAEDFPVAIAEPMTLRFVPRRLDHLPNEEIELDAADLDEVEFDGATFDLGEAIAQTLALAIDPFACGPNADAVRERVDLGDEAASGPFAALAALKKGLN